jgi:succinate dehydrogenase / fumarate reductase, membrane anchor subunit
MAETASARMIPARDRWGVFSWYFMRLSALALILLALGHFFIQHVANDVHALSLEFVAARWSGLGWRLYDALLLSLGLLHGLNGLRIVADDYIVQPRLNKAFRVLLVLIGAALLLIGGIAVIGGVRPAL